MHVSTPWGVGQKPGTLLTKTGEVPPDTRRGYPVSGGRKWRSEMTNTCKTCGTLFQGKGRAIYCGARCRRDMENRRRTWDAGARGVECLRANASMTNPLLDRTPEQSREWKRMAEEARASLGPRP
jgi:hypothetical protein